MSKQIKEFVLLDGHPSAKAGHFKLNKGKRGHPVSQHNVWCDDACNQEKASYLATLPPGKLKDLVAKLPVRKIATEEQPHE